MLAIKHQPHPKYLFTQYMYNEKGYVGGFILNCSMLSSLHCFPAPCHLLSLQIDDRLYQTCHAMWLFTLRIL